MHNKITRNAKKITLKNLIFLSGAAAAWILSGCQSNTIYFGTNTQFGIRAGVDTKQIPEVSIGYNRQEGVMLPLTNSDTTNSPDASPAGTDNKKFVGTNTGSGANRQDAYSVIAIFNGNAGSTNAAGATMGISQYFATGIAAQLLAEHGASVVGGPMEDMTNLVAISVQKAIEPLADAFQYFSVNDTSPSQLPNFNTAAQTVLINGTPLYLDFRSFVSGNPQTPTLDQVATVRANLETYPTIKPQIK